MTATSSAPVTLPSINEMFPEHMMRTAATTPKASIHRPTNHPLRPRYPVVALPPSVISFPLSGNGREIITPARSHKRIVGRAGSNDGAYSSGEDHDGERGSADNTKRHVCPTCSKRFNRPSSLKIHVNTHTGATPFRCPFPNCGREFNVNSNMRRHLRNHSATGMGSSSSSSSSSSPRSPVDSSLRRKRPESDGVFSFGVAIPPALSSTPATTGYTRAYYSTASMPYTYIPPPPPHSNSSHSPVSEEEDLASEGEDPYPDSNSDSADSVEDTPAPRPAAASSAASFRLQPVRTFKDVFSSSSSTRVAVSDERGRYGPYPPPVPRLIK